MTDHRHVLLPDGACVVDALLRSGLRPARWVLRPRGVVAQFRSAEPRDVWLYADGRVESHVDPHNPDAGPWMFVFHVLCDWWLAPLRARRGTPRSGAKEVSDGSTA